MSERTDNQSIECQFFTWETWEDFGDLMSLFFKPILKVRMGDFQIGEEFDFAILDPTMSLITLTRGEKEYDFKIVATAIPSSEYL